MSPSGIPPLSVRSLAYRAMRQVLGLRVSDHSLFRARVENRYGLEIGGPSGIFRDTGALPLYRYVAALDNCVFASQTLWEGSRAEGQTYSYHPGKAKGSHFIREGTALRGIANAAYDFVFSSHNLEHIANPVRALREWMRVTRPEGALIIVLPDYRRTFDHRRRPTPVAHMLHDEQMSVDEHDQTHLKEVLELHDLSRDPEAGAFEQFRQRCLRNYENRCLHHHVFDERNSRELMEAVGLSIVTIESVRPQHIVLLCSPARS